VFDLNKLEWFNQQHIARLAPEELAVRIRSWFDGAGLWDEAYLGERHAWFFAVLEFAQAACGAGSADFVTQGRYFFTDQIEYDDGRGRESIFRRANVAEHLPALEAALSQLPSFDAESIEAALRTTADVRGVKAASLIHACRVAVTGKSVSPGLFEVLTLLGRARVHARLAARRPPVVPFTALRFLSFNSLIPNGWRAAGENFFTSARSRADRSRKMFS